MILRTTATLISIALLNSPPVDAKVHISKYDACIQEADGVHPAILECMSSETESINQATNRLLSTHYSDGTKDAAARKLHTQQHAWDAFILLKCSIYLDLGGQRGELLEENCRLDETRRHKSYVADVLSSFGV